MKKLLGFISLAVVAFSLVFSSGVNSAYAYYACGSASQCGDVRMYYGEQQYASSERVYFTKGQTIYYAWDNDSPGIMQVGFAVYNSAGARVSKEKLAAREGNNYDFWTVTSSGYYYLFAACEGGNDTRCSGGGLLKKW